MIYKNTFGTEQTDTTIITPSGGKKVYVTKTIIEGGAATIEFLTSDIDVSGAASNAVIQSTGKLINMPDIEGAIDEVLSVSCDASTTITVLYEEL